MGPPLGHLGTGGVRQVNDSPLRTLIVNADDYGLTQPINRAIEAAHSAGVVTSTSVMVNQIASGEVTALAVRRPELGIGLHLTLTLGTPISEATHVRSLLDVDGRFLSRTALIGRLRGGQVAPTEIARECFAQLARLHELGIDPDHWNLHQHLGEQVFVGEVAARSMFDNGLRVARNPRRVSAERLLSPKGLLDAERARRRRRGERAITGLHSTPVALLDAPPSTWMRLLPSLKAGVVEALCHPGEADDAELVELTPDWVAVRAEELAALLNPTLRDFLHEHGIQLTSFGRAFASRTNGHRGTTSV